MGSELMSCECCGALSYSWIRAKGELRCTSCGARWPVSTDEALASLRARLEAAERERDEALNKARHYEETVCLDDGIRLMHEDGALTLPVNTVKLGELFEQRDAALRELAEAKRLDSFLRDHADYYRKRGNTLWDRAEAANALLRSVEWNGHPCGGLSTCVVCGYDIEHGHSEGCELGRHLAASPSPPANSGVADQSLASPEGDGAGRECAYHSDEAQANCELCDTDARRAQGGDSNAEGSGA